MTQASPHSYSAGGAALSAEQRPAASKIDLLSQVGGSLEPPTCRQPALQQAAGAGEARWEHRGVRRTARASVVLSAAWLLAACSPPVDLDMSVPLQDGQFVGQSNPDEQGAVGTVTIEVQDGKIVSSNYQTVAADGHPKDKDYGKTKAGEIGNQEFYARAQAAVESYDRYAQALVEKQNPTEVDVISGATVAHSQFLQAAVRAVLAAQGKEDTGQADSINLPSLELDESDY